MHLAELERSARVLLGPRHAFDHSSFVGEQPVNRRLQRGVSGRLCQRVLDQRERAIGGRQHGQQQERFGARRPSRCRGDELGRDLPRPCTLPGRHVGVRGPKRASVHVFRRPGRGYAQSMLVQLRRHDWRAAAKREGCCLLERGCGVRIRAFRGQTGMARARDGIVDESGEDPVGLSPLLVGHTLIQPGGEQRMGEDHSVAGRSNHPGRERRLERTLFDLCGAEERVRRMPRSRDDQERGAALAQGARRAARGRASPSASGRGSGSVGSLLSPRESMALASSSAKNGFPPEPSWRRRSVGRAKLRPSRRCKIPWSAPALSGADAAGARSGCRRSHARPRTPGCVAEPAGEKDADVLVRQSPEGKGESGGGGRIQPLDVVDRHQDRPTVGEQLQGRADAHGERAEIDGLVRVVSKEQGDLECTSPRARQLADDLAERVLEQVSQAGMCNTQLHLGGTRRENAEPTLACGFDAGEPERRFPDPCLALQNQRRHPVGCGPVEEGMENAEFIVPAQRVDAPRSFAAIVTPQGWKVSP